MPIHLPDGARNTRHGITRKLWKCATDLSVKGYQPMDTNRLPIAPSDACILPGRLQPKRLISSEGKKKKAFFVLQQYYQNKTTTHNMPEMQE
jgi:hypothetical protein